MSLRIQSLAFRFRNFSLFVRDLECPSARLTAIVGPNGAGKTTLLKCLSGIYPVAPGAVIIDGRDLNVLSARERARRLAFVPQEHATAFNYAVGDFVLTGRAAFVPLMAVPSGADDRYAAEALAFVGLTAYADRPLLELSSGERRLVLIARALAQRSDVLVLDEPTTFLDPKHETAVMTLVKRLATDMGKTVVLTLHSLDMAAAFADTVVFMKNGGVVAAGPPDAILSEDLLENVYDIKMTLLRHAGRTHIVK
jgi:iron complex transport system ATP-binding protein